MIQVINNTLLSYYSYYYLLILYPSLSGELFPPPFIILENIVALKSSSISFEISAIWRGLNHNQYVNIFLAFRDCITEWMSSSITLEMCSTMSIKPFQLTFSIWNYPRVNTLGNQSSAPTHSSSIFEKHIFSLLKKRKKKGILSTPLSFFDPFYEWSIEID